MFADIREEVQDLCDENEQLKRTIDSLKAEIISLQDKAADVGNSKAYNKLLEENTEFRDLLKPIVNFLGGTFLLKTDNTDLAVAVLRAKAMLMDKK